MEKIHLMDALKSLIHGYRSYTIHESGEGVIRVYNPSGSFTAEFITDVINVCRDEFIGISVDCEGRPYMLFTYEVTKN